MKRQTPNIYSATTCAAIDCGPGIRARQTRNADAGERRGNLERGSAFHWAAAEYIQRLVRAGVECDVRIADEILDESLRRHNVPPSLEADLRRMWSAWVRRYILEHEVEGVEMGLAVDWLGKLAPFAPELDHDTGDKAAAARAGWLWRGALDLVDRGGASGGLRITDWKLSPYTPSPTELRTMMQPRQYSGALALAFGLDHDDEITFRLYSVPYHVEVVVEFRVGDVVDDFLAWLDVFRRLDSLPPMDPYWITPRRVQGCDLCSARPTCEAWPSDIGDDAPPILRVVTLERRLKAARAELRAHVREHGEAVEMGHRAHAKPKERNDSDALRLLEFCAARNIEPDPSWFSVNLTSLRSKKRGIGEFSFGQLEESGIVRKKPAGSSIVIEPVAGEVAPKFDG